MKLEVLFFVVVIMLMMSIGADLVQFGRERKRTIGFLDLIIDILWVLFLIWVIS